MGDGIDGDSCLWEIEWMMTAVDGMDDDSGLREME